jgi:hypothetical protein
MPSSMMAIVSQTQFAKDCRTRKGQPPAPGDVVPLSQYVSTNRNLNHLSEGGDLYLVTVRPGEALWLVAVLRSPQFARDRWRATENTVPVSDIGSIKRKLRFTSGKGVSTKKGALGMSLQTPRTLTSEDVELLEAAVSRDPPETLRPRIAVPAKTRPGTTLNPRIEPEVIKRKLELCRQKDKRAVRGAYRLAPCISESAVRRFEKRHGLALPDDYRTFVTRVGNGGPGPCDPLDECTEMRPQVMEFASKPFPHSKAWNLPRRYFENIPEIDEENEEESYQKHQKYMDKYWDPRHIQGSLPIYHQGCNYYFLLVLNGAERGTIWTDERADDAGVIPIALNPDAPTHEYADWWVRDRSKGRKKRVSFGVLYNFWLDRNLRRLRIPLEG